MRYPIQRKRPDDIWGKMMSWIAWFLCGCFAFMTLTCLITGICLGDREGYFYAGVFFLLFVAMCPGLEVPAWLRVALGLIGLALS